MTNINKKQVYKLPESTIQIMEEAQKSYRHLQGSIANIINIIPKLPKIDIPEIRMPKFQERREIVSPANYDLIHEENEWRRHKEILDIQNTVLKIQTQILKEQKSTTKLTKVILFLTIIGILITVILNLVI